MIRDRDMFGLVLVAAGHTMMVGLVLVCKERGWLNCRWVGTSGLGTMDYGPEGRRELGPGLEKSRFL